jgi:hypothetical protein
MIRETKQTANRREVSGREREVRPCERKRLATGLKAADGHVRRWSEFMTGLVMVPVIDRIRWRQWIRFDDQSVSVVLVLLLSFAPLVMSSVFCL